MLNLFIIVIKTKLFFHLDIILKTNFMPEKNKQTFYKECRILLILFTLKFKNCRKFLNSYDACKA